MSNLTVFKEITQNSLDYFDPFDEKSILDSLTKALDEQNKKFSKPLLRKDIQDIDLIIPHQANINIIQTGMEKLGLDMDKTFTNLHKYGNTAGASVPIAMSEAMSKGLIKEGDLIVTVAFGGGLAWGANVIQF